MKSNRTNPISCSRRLLCCLFLIAFFSAMPIPVHAAAKIVIVNGDGTGVGLNDPTPATPIGGNAGTTLGQQRLNAVEHAAKIWAGKLKSLPTIYVAVTFEALTCDDSSAVLGSAGPTLAWYNFTNAPFPNTFYPFALANALHGSDLSPGDQQIGAKFNVNLGSSGCLSGTSFYLGLDNNHGGDVDLVETVLHELGHGLGFYTTTSGSTGAFLSSTPSVYDRFLLDTTAGMTWAAMTTDAQRANSALNTRKLVWNGPRVTADVPSVLQLGIPELRITAPASAAGSYLVGTASFGPALNSTGVTGQMAALSGSYSGPGCDPFTTADALAVNGKIALIDRGICNFVVKVKNAQDAGAIGVVVADNVAGSPPPNMSGTDSTITIPSVRITQADGDTLKAAIGSGVTAKLSLNMSQYASADPSHRMMMFTPNPYQSGSSVSHWDSSAIPNLLMQPNYSANSAHSLDLTLSLFQDIGWTIDTGSSTAPIIDLLLMD